MLKNLKDIWNTWTICLRHPIKMDHRIRRANVVVPVADCGFIILPYRVCIENIYWLTSFKTAKVCMRQMLSLKKPCGIGDTTSVCWSTGCLPCPRRVIWMVQSRERIRVCISVTCVDRLRLYKTNGSTRCFVMKSATW